MLVLVVLSLSGLILYVNIIGTRILTKLDQSLFRPEVMVQNFEFELARYTAALLKYENGIIDIEELRQRFDILYSRYNVITQSQNTLELLEQDTPEFFTATMAIFNALREQERIVYGDEADIVVLPLVGQAEKLVSIGRELSRAAVQGKEGFAHRIYQRVNDLKGGLAFSVLATLSFVFIGVAASFVEVAGSRKRGREKDRLRRVAEAALQELQIAFAARDQMLAHSQQLQLALESANDAVVMARPDGEIVFSNFRYALGGVMKEATSVCWCTAGVKRFKLEDCVFVPVGPDDKPITAIYQTRTNEKVLMEWSTVPVNKEGDESLVLAIARDVTSQREAEKKFIRAQRAESVGMMAAGLAHDINNALTTIVGASYIARMDCDGNKKVEFELDQIDIAAGRAQSMSGELLQYGRKSLIEAEVSNVVDIAKEVVAVALSTTPSAITLDLRYTETELFVETSAFSLHQVLFNLIRNAVDAIGAQTGKVTIEVCKVDNQIEICVNDNGPGIPLEIQDDIFKPFFSTKPVGSGTGMGLSVVKSLVEIWGGSINLTSQCGKGSNFRIILNAANKMQAASSDPVSTGTETLAHIVCVDDQADVLGVVARILERLGHEVTTFTDPVLAVEWYRDNHDIVDLVISDVIMPQINGPEMISRMRYIDPQLKVMYMSAFSDMKFGVDTGTTRFLQKPVHPSVLSQNIEEVISL